MRRSRTGTADPGADGLYRLGVRRVQAAAAGLPGAEVLQRRGGNGNDGVMNETQQPDAESAEAEEREGAGVPAAPAKEEQDADAAGV